MSRDVCIAHLQQPTLAKIHQLWCLVDCIRPRSSTSTLTFEIAIIHLTRPATRIKMPFHNGTAIVRPVRSQASLSTPFTKSPRHDSGALRSVD